jgi:hypothetical protein
VIRKTRFLFLSIALIAAVLLGAGRGSDDKQSFQAGKAGQYSHQTSEKVLVGAKAFDNADLVAEAFGKKTDLLKYGVLPVLVVVENQRDTSIDLREMEVSLVASDGRHVSAMSPEEISYLGKNGHRRPKGPGEGIPLPLPQKKNPLVAPEITGRAFAAGMLPPGDSVSGFFYFEAMSEVGDSLYLSGMRDPRTKKEVMYFEFPLKKDDAK